MICDPFRYYNFCKWKSVGKYILLSVFVCVILPTDSIVPMILSLIYLDNEKYDRTFMVYINTRFGVNIFHLVEVLLVKSLYSYAVVKMAEKTKKTLFQSDELTGQNVGDSKRKLQHQRIYYIIMIPHVLKVFCSGHELLRALIPIIDYLGVYGGCFQQTYLREEILI